MILRMTLKSDAIPGSGKSLAGVIDTDIYYDQYGIPFIPAKRLKGILRESAEELEKYGALAGTTNDLFGTSGHAEGCAFQLDNGQVQHDQAYRNFFLKYKKKITSEEVLDYFTYLRSQTSINEAGTDDEGTAKENSLRISRVLRKGLVFEFPLSCNSGQEEDLQKIIKVVRAFGSTRSRGFGEISLELIEDNHADVSNGVSSPTLNGHTSLKIELENLAPLLVSSTPGESQISSDFIPGSAILGALAAKYLQQNNNQADEKFLEYFYSGKIQFGNLYPKPKDDQRCFQPAPLSVKKVKVDKGDSGTEYMDLSSGNDLSEYVFKGGIDGYVAAGRNEKYSVKKSVEAHHRRPDDRRIAKATEDNGEFFQFEILDSGQCFSGEISGETSHLQMINDLLTEDALLRLGKSRTGQYGKCKLTVEPYVREESPEKWEANDTLSFILKSDMVLLNENGFAEPSAERFVQHLEECLGLKPRDLKLEKAWLKTGLTGGFLGIWHLPRVQYPCLSAGSVVTVKNVSGNTINEADIKHLVSQPLGLRTQDGMGQFELYHDMADNAGSVAIQSVSPIAEKSDENKIVNIDQFIDAYIYQRTRRYLLSKVSKEVKNLGLNNSFLSRISAMVKDANGFEKLAGNFNELKDEQSKKLKKMKKELYLEVTNGGFRISQNNFSSACNQAPLPDDLKQNDALKQIFSDEGLHWQLYQNYALACLNQLKYLNRQNEKGDEV